MEKTNDILKKIKEQKLKGEDLTDFFDVFLWYANQSPYAEDELYGWDKSVQFIFSDVKNFYLTTDNTFSENPKLKLEDKEIASPSAKVIINAETFMGMICGRIRYSSLAPGMFKVEGDVMQWQFFLILMGMMMKELS